MTNADSLRPTAFNSFQTAQPKLTNGSKNQTTMKTAFDFITRRITAFNVLGFAFLLFGPEGDFFAVIFAIYAALIGAINGRLFLSTFRKKKR